MSGYSEERLNAFVDDQVTDDEREEMLAAAAQDPVLRQQLSELSDLKALVQRAYRDIPADEPELAESSLRKRKPFSMQWRSALAACLLVGVGGLAGWGMEDLLRADGNQASGARIITDGAFEPLRIDSERGNNVVLDISAGTPDKVNAGLKEVERLLRRYREEGLDTRVEVVARGEGLNLVRAGDSADRTRVLRMMSEYENLSFVACEKAIERWQRKNGKAVELLPGVGRTPVGLERAIDHLREGWWYVRI